MKSYNPIGLFIRVMYVGVVCPASERVGEVRSVSARSLFITFFAFTSLLFIAQDLAMGQFAGPFDERFTGLKQNSVTSSATSGDTLWTGPGLNRYVESLDYWAVPQGADSVIAGRGRVFSVATDEGAVIAGLGYTIEFNEGTTPVAMGYYIKDKSLDPWDFIPFPLDPQPSQSPCDETATGSSAGCDTTFVYGGSTYSRVRITVPEQSPPYEVSRRGAVLMSVNWASGLLRSLDKGTTWERIPLPPSTAREMVPENTYAWRSVARDGSLIERYDPRTDNNLLGFGLHIDKQDRTWVGTAGGVNISSNALNTSSDSIRWKRVSYDGSEYGLLGNWIIRIKQNPIDGAVWMTNWPASALGERYGVVVTRDGGLTFHQTLIGEKINDIGFFGPYVFAAGNELFISPDQGISWRQIGQIRSETNELSSSATYYTVSSTPSGVYVGTSEGLAFSDDGGYEWQVTRVDFPFRGGNAYAEDVRDVDAYAYPNPFSPTQHSRVRIRFELSKPGNVKMNIFDFGMNQVYQRSEAIAGTGVYELIWDGLTSRGGWVPNGTYFVRLETPDETHILKLLVLD